MMEVPIKTLNEKKKNICKYESTRDGQQPTRDAQHLNSFVYSLFYDRCVKTKGNIRNLR